MATSYTALLGLALPVTGELQGTWGTTVNNSITQLCEDSIAGVATASVLSADWTLTTTGSGAANQARMAILIPTGSPGVSRNIIAPSQSKTYTVINQSNAAVVLKGAATTGVTIASGDTVIVAWNGSDFVAVKYASNSYTNLTVSGTLTLSGGTANGVAYLNASKQVTSGSALTFDGTTFVAPLTSLSGNGVVLTVDRTGTGGNDRTNVQFSNSGTVRGGIGTVGASDGIYFNYGTTEGMRLTSTGLGIGTSSPAKKLDMAGSYRAQIDTSNGSLFGSTLTLAGDNGINQSGVRIVAGYDSGFGMLFQTSTNSQAGYNSDPSLLTYTTRMKIDSSGNLGLGVTPSAWGGTNTKSLDISLWTSLANGNAFGSALTFNGYYNGTNWIYKQNNSATKYESDGQHRWYTAPSGTAGNAISFTQAMTLDASGNLLVGDTIWRLSGIAYPGQNIQLGARTFIGTTSGGDTVLGGLSGSNFTAIYAGGTERMRIDSSGNVAIGTNTANSGGGGSKWLTIGSTVGNPYSGGISFAIGGTTQLWLYQDTDNLVNFQGTGSNAGFKWTYNGVDRMRLDSSGNLLVGTTSNNGTITSFNSNAAGRAGFFMINAASSLSADAVGISKYDNNTTTSQVFVKFFINNNTAASGLITANGANAATFTSSSDARLKENITTLPNQLANICALKPSEFDYKDGTGHQIGFIAQEMQEIYPDCVAEDGNGMLMISGWSKTEARLVKAIQEQQAIIESLTARITTLEAK